MRGCVKMKEMKITTKEFKLKAHIIMDDLAQVIAYYDYNENVASKYHGLMDDLIDEYESLNNKVLK